VHITAVSGLLNPPTLDATSGELLLRSDDNITLTCYGDLPLNWTYPVNQVTPVSFRLIDCAALY